MEKKIYCSPKIYIHRHHIHHLMTDSDMDIGVGGDDEKNERQAKQTFWPNEGW